MKFLSSVRIILFLVIYLGSISSSFGQLYTKEMRIPYYSQNTSNSCWAASMKMIMDFHSDSDPATSPISICDLTKGYLILQQTSKTQIKKIQDKPCCVDCPIGGCSTSQHPPCTSTLLSGSGSRIAFSYKSDVPVKAQPDAYDLLFAEHGYSSIQEVNQIGNPIRWGRIVNQIETCRPFIINIDPSPTAVNELDANHALVISGYQEGSTDDERFVIGYDPWKPCCSDSNRVLFPYSIFERTDTIGVTTTEGGTYLVNRVLSTVHSIQSGTMTEAADTLAWESCEVLKQTYGTKDFFDVDDGLPNQSALLKESTVEEKPFIRLVSNSHTPETHNHPPNDTSGFVALLKNNAENIAGYTQTALEEKAFDEVLNQPENFHATVKYMTSRLVNRRYFLSCLFPPRKLEKVVLQGYEVKDVVSGLVDKQLVSTFQRRGDEKWSLRRIATYTSLEEKITVRMPNNQEPVELNNKEQSATANEDTDFELIKYTPFQYEFFSFKKNGIKYLAPAEDYDFGSENLNLTKHQAYREGKVIRSLRRQTLDYEKFIKSLFSQGIYKEFYGLQNKALGNIFNSNNAIIVE